MQNSCWQLPLDNRALFKRFGNDMGADIPIAVDGLRRPGAPAQQG